MEFEMDELYLTIINNLNDGVYFVDLDRRILFWNKAAERITGYSADEIMGRQCQDNILNHIDEDGQAAVRYRLSPVRYHYRRKTASGPRFCTA